MRPIGKALAVLILCCLAATVSAQDGTPQGEIGVEATGEEAARQDRAIAERIRNILGELDGFANVTVEVNSGVVTLSGRVAEPDQVARLDDLVARIGGVVTIENEVLESTDIAERLNPALDRFEKRLSQLIAALPILLIALAVGMAVFVGGLFLAWLKNPWEKLAPNAFIADIYRQLVRVVFFIGGVVIALDILGATALLGTILGAAGIVGLAVGFAVRDTVENFIASIMLSIRQPFRPNDLIEIEGDMGKVIRLTSRATILLSLDGNHIRIPNATVFKSRIVNYSRNDERRFQFSVGVDAEANLAHAREIAQETVQNQPFVLSEPKAAAWLDNLTESGAILQVTGWINQNDTDFSMARGESLRLVKSAIEAAGIAIPDTTYRLRIENPAMPTSEPTKPAKPQSPPPQPEQAAPSPDVEAKSEEALERFVEAERAETDDLLTRDGLEE